MKRIYLSCFALFCFVWGQAQSDLEIITFDDDKGKREKQTITTGIIKTNPLSMLNGRQFIEYEKPVTQFLSVEAGVGLTFSPLVSGINNFYAQLYDELTQPQCGSPNFEEGWDYCDQADYNNFDIRQARMGVWLSAGARFYFFNNAPEDGYLSLNLKYHTNGYRIQGVEEDQIQFVRQSTFDFRESVRNFDYTVRIGFQTLYDPLVTDYFVGVGIRSTNQTRLDTGFDTSTGFYANKFQTITGSTLLFEWGVRIGVEMTKEERQRRKTKKRRRN